MTTINTTTDAAEARRYASSEEAARAAKKLRFGLGRAPLAAEVRHPHGTNRDRGWAVEVGPGLRLAAECQELHDSTAVTTVSITDSDLFAAGATDITAQGDWGDRQLWYLPMKAIYVDGIPKAGEYRRRPARTVTGSGPSGRRTVPEYWERVPSDDT